MSTRPKRKPRPVRIPVMPELSRLFGLQMHLSFATLRDAPTVEAFDALAICFNTVGLAAERRGEKFAAEIERINGAARGLNQIRAKVLAISEGAALKLQAHELAAVELGVVAADALVPRLGVDELNDARLVRRAMAAERAQA